MNFFKRNTYLFAWIVIVTMYVIDYFTTIVLPDYFTLIYLVTGFGLLVIYQEYQRKIQFIYYKDCNPKEFLKEVRDFDKIIFKPTLHQNLWRITRYSAFFIEKRYDEALIEIESMKFGVSNLLRNQFFKFIYLINKAQLEIVSGNLNQADLYTEEAKRVFPKIKRGKKIAQLILVDQEIDRKRLNGDYTFAVEHYLKIISMNKGPLSVLLCRFELAKVYFELNEYNNAKSILEDIIPIAKHMEIQKDMIVLLQIINEKNESIL